MPTDPTGGWGGFILALAVFFASHMIPARPAVRTRLVALMGRGPYIAAYSLVSLAILYWLIRASAEAPFVELWPAANWQRHVPLAIMPLAAVLFVFGLMSRNPLSIGGRGREGFDPERPGVAGIVRHPVLWAALLWSLAHLVPNGDLAHVVLFGMFAAFSVLGMLIFDRRMRRRLGDAEWRRLAARTSNIPFARFNWRFRPDAGTALRLGAAVLLYLALLFGHPWFAGVPAIIV